MRINNLHEGDYFVWSSHREENIDLKPNFDKMINSINRLAETYNKKILFSVHPRTRNKIEGIELNENIVLSEPLGLIDYYKLQKNSICVISDSGTVTEEAKILNFKAILLRTSTEHPEGIDAGSIVLGNNDWRYLKRSVKLCIDMPLPDNISLGTHSKNNILHYTDTNFSEKVCKIINGYTGVVNKFIWMK